MRTTECKVLTTNAIIKNTLLTDDCDSRESDDMETDENQRKAKSEEENQVQIIDVPTLVTDILNELVDRIIINIDTRVCEEQTSTDSGFQASEPTSSRSTKEFYRRTFVFDDSNLDDKEFSEDEDEEEVLDEHIEDDFLGDSRESLAYNFEGNLDENFNKSITTCVPTKPIIAVNNLVINKYEIKPLSKSSETISAKTEERPKRVKKFSLSSMFLRKKNKRTDGEKTSNSKSKTEIEHEDYDNFDPFQNFSSIPSKSLSKSKKFSSAFDISEKSPATLSLRTPSLKKRIANLHTETKTLFRSMSFRELSKKNKEKQKLAEQKNIEWKSSLQRLVENDTGISYNDFSFVNYDQLNTVSYSTSTPEKKQTNVYRTQSMVEKVTNTHLINNKY